IIGNALDRLAILVMSNSSSQFSKKLLRSFVVLFLTQNSANQISGVWVKSSEKILHLSVNPHIQFVNIDIATEFWLQTISHVITEKPLISLQIIQNGCWHNLDSVCLFQSSADTTQADISAMHRKHKRNDSGVSVQTGKGIMLPSELPSTVTTAHNLLQYSLASFPIRNDRWGFTFGTNDNFYRSSILDFLFNVSYNLSLKLQVAIKR